MFSLQTFMANAPKYFLEGAAVAIAAYYIPSRQMAIRELFMVAITAALTFWILDTFSPAIGSGARFGAGFGIGAKTVGFGGVERFCGAKKENVPL